MLMGVSFALVGYGGMPGDEGQGQVAASENAIRRYEIISHTRDFSVPDPLRKFDTVVEVGGDSRNRFIMHRIHRTGPQRGAIMLLPPLVNNFNVYMVDESGDPTQSIAAQLALAGYDVYGYSPRQTGLPPRPCTTGAFDCSVMLHWSW